jgi:hypothetical protein
MNMGWHYEYDNLWHDMLQRQYELGGPWDRIQYQNIVSKAFLL